jgi:hypothetical protein
VKHIEAQLYRTGALVDLLASRTGSSDEIEADLVFINPKQRADADEGHGSVLFRF